MLVAGLDDGHDVLVDLDVAGRIVGARRHDPGPAAAELHPFRLGRDGLLPIGQGAEVDGRLGDLGGHGLALGLAQPQRLEFLGREQHACETIAVAIGHRGHDFGGDFFRRDGFPGRELAVAGRIDAPPGAGRIEPAELILLARRLGGHIAIDFHAVLVETPLIDHVIAVGVEELPQQDAFRALDDPTDVAVDLLDRNLAARHVLGLWPVVIDPLLAGSHLQDLRGRGASGQNRHRNSTSAAATPTRQPAAAANLRFMISILLNPTYPSRSAVMYSLTRDSCIVGFLGSEVKLFSSSFRLPPSSFACIVGFLGPEVKRARGPGLLAFSSHSFIYAIHKLTPLFCVHQNGMNSVLPRGPGV